MSQISQFILATDLLQTLTGNIGAPVHADILRNIDITGGTYVTVTGTPLTNTLDITLANSIVASFVTDAGTAVSVAHALTINGGTNLNSAGAAAVVTLNLDDTISLSTVNATTFDTNNVAAGVTLQATELAADGTDANIDITIVPKGTGHVIIDRLQLLTPLAVEEGGTGLDTLTDHSVLVGSGVADITPLTVGTNGQVLLGSTMADPVFAALTSTDGSIGYTLGAGTLDLSAHGGTSRDNMLYVGKHGNDANNGESPERAKLTIQAAVTAASAGDTIIVYPGTYTETITHAASNLTLIAEGKPSNCIITQANANVINFAGYTGIQYKYFHISCTAATTAIWTIQGTTGLCSFKECQISMTTAADIAAIAQPGIARVTGAGTISIALGKAAYYHTGDGGGTAQKGAFSVANGGLISLSLIEDLEITNSGTALVSGVGIDTASTGNFEIHDCIITVTDPGATIVVGLAYLGGTGTASEFYRNTLHVTVGAANTGYGFFSADTASDSRFFFNHIHVVDTGGTSYSYLVGAGATVTAIFDDVVAVDGATVVAGGIFYEVKSPVDGDLICSGPTASGNRNITVANTDNTATASNACMCVSVGGATSTGDPYTNYLVTGAGTYSVGIDNSDSDKFKITTGATPSAGTDLFTITSAGAISLGSTTYPTTVTQGDLLVASAANTLSVIAGGTATHVLTANGAGAAPTYQAAAGETYCSDAEAIAGTVTDEAVAPSTLKAKLGAQTDHGVLIGSGTAAAVTALTVGTNGQVLVGSSAADPVFATITNGTGITTTLGAGTLALKSTGTTINVQIGSSYTTVLSDEGKCITMNNAGASTLTIPLNSSVAYPLGTIIAVQQLGAGQVTLTPTGGVTFRSADDAYKLVKQYSGCSLIKIAMDDTWGIFGDVEA